MSKSSVYLYLEKGYLSVSDVEFPRVVKFRPRRKKPSGYIPKTFKINRTYADFLSCTAENEISSWVEMDTVVGRIGGKTILTIYFTFCNFMAGFRMTTSITMVKCYLSPIKSARNMECQKQQIANEIRVKDTVHNFMIFSCSSENSEPGRSM